MKNSLLILLLLICCPSVRAADKNSVPAQSRSEIARTLTRIISREVNCPAVKVERVQSTRKKVSIFASVELSYYPFREQNVRAIYDSVRLLLPVNLRKAQLEIITDKRRIEELIPVALRSSVDSKKNPAFTYAPRKPLATRISSPWHPSAGLRDRHIALWQSHGRYFDQKEDRWKWQRSRLWETCEDLYTQSYVLPFLVPMLENAGANVLLPRERDVQKAELIADNDAGVDYATRYAEQSGACPWHDAGVGFAHLQTIYRTGENPFTDGTSRMAETIVSGDESTAEWMADVPEQGEYAVYVSYKTLPNSADDAHYSVHHMGGTSTFAVNQTMGGGTWVYLGHFPFAAGKSGAVVTLTNRAGRAGRIVTADAVKIGGGMGNIARTVCDSLRRRGASYTEKMSGYPRFCEGARYWLQWAGFGEEVYAQKNHKDDYKEDYMSRGHWVNALMGGTERLPGEKGLGIPVDLALAFHSDAGVRDGDEVIGTLGIFCTKDNDGRFEGGADRYLSRDLTDLVMSQIVGDIRETFEPEWVRRGQWNRAYYEARVPCAPTMLLELLSHQNFADMRYGHDPRFKFVVSRAIYKGILRYISSQYGTPYIVQPLPVEAFSTELTGTSDVTLRWLPTVDSLEATAVPTGYIVYTRIDEGGFDEGRLVQGTSCTLPIESERIYSFRVTAVNDGGESFPSEILAACRVENERGRVLVVNGFDRVSAPLSLRQDTTAGFRRDLDAGVPYLNDISFIGNQRVFDCAMARSENDRIALGSCQDDYETEVIGGNTFDYPVLHGEAIAAAGWSFASAGVRAVEQGSVPLGDYAVVDLVLGLQRSVTVGRGARGWEYAAFSPELQDALREYARRGGALFATGSYVVSDLWTGNEATDASRVFAHEVLRSEYDQGYASSSTRIMTAPSPAGFLGGDYRFNTQLQPDCYAVGTTDVIRPMAGAFPVLRYTESGQTVAVAWAGNDAGRVVVVGFPFESLTDPVRRRALMRDVLHFLDPVKK